MTKKIHGQVLPIVMVSLVVLTLIISALVNWIQNESKTSTKEQKSSSAINLAEAAIDRGKWKLQSTTSTWAAAAVGVVIPNYNFDTTFTDIPGGTYRIKFSSGVLANGAATVTITAEGRDLLNKETRAIQAVVEDQVIYSALMSGGNVSWAQGLGIYWGPLMSQGNIQLMDDVVGSLYFPRKFAKGVVIGTAANPRDTNGLAPPNTDNVEWWTEYSGVPPVPVLDFASMRSSAAATGTLNVYGCGCAASPSYTVNGAVVPGWDHGRNSTTCTNDGDTAPHTNHFGNSTNFYAAQHIPKQDYVWYWDGDLSLEGDGYNGSLATSLQGTIVVRGNLTINSSGDMVYTGHVPSNAWVEEQRLLINTYDTAATGEYPADAGYHTSENTFGFGTENFSQPGQGGGWISTVGIKGFTYVGGNLTIVNFMDFNGAIWVNGSVTAAYASSSAFCGIYYDDTLQVPTLNVILQQLSWQEVTPSATVWP